MKLNTITPLLLLVLLTVSNCQAEVVQSAQEKSDRGGKKYDPRSADGRVTVLDMEFKYGDADRTVPLRIYLPEEKRAPVVLFSHGLGGSRENNKFLGNHWAARGYAGVFMQHIGSDIDAMRDAKGLEKILALQAAASARNALARCEDVKATLSYVEKINKKGPYAGQFDTTKVGMSGHSFGAITTQAVSGQSYGRRGQAFLDKRIKAAIAFSPSVPLVELKSDTFSNVRIPWLLMTGTKDNGIINRKANAQSRRGVFQELPKRRMFYELVLDEAEHMAFSDADLAFAKIKRNPKHHPAIQAVSSAFWDTYLKGDKSAKTWLRGSGPRLILDRKDLWQKK